MEPATSPVEPMAIEAAAKAERRYMEVRDEKQRIVELELQQARYEASLAERRYAAYDPDNRLIAAQLEKSWEAALRRLETCQARLEAVRRLLDCWTWFQISVGSRDCLILSPEKHRRAPLPAAVAWRRGLASIGSFISSRSVSSVPRLSAFSLASPFR